MLVIKRRDGEEIVIDGGIRITILETARGSVRIGIEAPEEIGVHRAEVDARRRREAALVAAGEES